MLGIQTIFGFSRCRRHESLKRVPFTPRLLYNFLFVHLSFGVLFGPSFFCASISASLPSIDATKKPINYTRHIVKVFIQANTVWIKKIRKYYCKNTKNKEPCALECVYTLFLSQYWLIGMLLLAPTKPT